MKRAATLVILTAETAKDLTSRVAMRLSLTIVFHKWLDRWRKSLRTLARSFAPLRMTNR
jgi:hypothetical protein